MRKQYFSPTGPWRGMWIKLGCDPRTNALNRTYQLIDFRAPRIVQAKSAVKVSSTHSPCNRLIKRQCPVKLAG